MRLSCVAAMHPVSRAAPVSALEAKRQANLAERLPASEVMHLANCAALPLGGAARHLANRAEPAASAEA